MHDALPNGLNLLGLMCNGAGVAILTLDLWPDYRVHHTALARDKAISELAEVTVRGLEREKGEAAPSIYDIDLGEFGHDRLVTLWRLAGLSEHEFERLTRRVRSWQSILSWPGPVAPVRDLDDLAQHAVHLAYPVDRTPPAWRPSIGWAVLFIGLGFLLQVSSATISFFQ